MKQGCSIVGVGHSSTYQNRLITFISERLNQEKASDCQIYENIQKYRLEYNDFDILQYQPRLDQCAKLALLACDEALKKVDYTLDQRVGIYIQTNCGVMNLQDRYIKYVKKNNQGNSILFQHTAHNLIVGLLSIKYKFKGYHTTLVCSSENDVAALQLASLHLALKKVDMAILIDTNTNKEDGKNGYANAFILKYSNPQDADLKITNNYKSEELKENLQSLSFGCDLAKEKATYLCRFNQRQYSVTGLDFSLLLYSIADEILIKKQVNDCKIKDNIELFIKNNLIERISYGKE